VWLLLRNFIANQSSEAGLWQRWRFVDSYRQQDRSTRQEGHKWRGQRAGYGREATSGAGNSANVNAVCGRRPGAAENRVSMETYTQALTQGKRTAQTKAGQMMLPKVVPARAAAG
jgi:hypothetical protein